MNKIDENWDLFEHKTKIRTYLKKLDKNWDQKGILTFLFWVHHLIAILVATDGDSTKDVRKLGHLIKCIKLMWLFQMFFFFSFVYLF